MDKFNDMMAKPRPKNTLMDILSGLILIMRPKQWTKNLILFAGIIFSANLFDYNLFRDTVYGFCLFCFFSGCAYIINDLIDFRKDRNHPIKCKRPLASGQITIQQAVLFLFFVFILTLWAAFRLNAVFAVIGLIYVLLIFLYSFALKYVVIADVATIALGFVLRAVAGAILVNTPLSPWLIACTVFLSLFLAINKRKHEIESFTAAHKSPRDVLKRYTSGLINGLLMISKILTFTTYALFGFTSEKPIFFPVTIIFVLFGVFRYEHTVRKMSMGGNPELILLQDKPLILDIILWLCSCIWIIYYS